MPDQNQPTSPTQPAPAAPPQPETPPVAPPPVAPPPPVENRPNFVAFEETSPAPQPAPMGGPATPPPPPPPIANNVVTPSGGSKKKILIIVGVLVLLLLIIGGIVLAMQSRQSEDVTPTPMPEAVTPTAYCSQVQVYDIEGNSISDTALTNLQPGSIVRFAASGVTTSGTFDKARFTINGVQRPEVTTKITGTDEFYDEYEIPADITTFDITAEVHHLETDTWY